MYNIKKLNVNGGSGFAGTVETIKELELKAKVSDNRKIRKKYYSLVRKFGV